MKEDSNFLEFGVREKEARQAFMIFTQVPPGTSFTLISAGSNQSFHLPSRFFLKYPRHPTHSKGAKLGDL
jgi:hypothetical protein